MGCVVETSFARILDRQTARGNIVYLYTPAHIEFERMLG